jgi:glycerophosphoryl diester phosphodiesterase
MTLIFQPPVIAHRGVSSIAPENTMSAFVRAVQQGIEWVEFDVMLARCGTPIVIHDETLDRTTGAKGGVGDFDYSYLRTLDAGAWFKPIFSGERIPTFAEVLDLLAATGLKANIEIKPLPDQDEITVRQAVGILSQYFPQNSDSILLSSFSLPALKLMRAMAPSSYLGLLMHEWMPDWRAQAASLNCVSVHVNQEILTEARAREIKSDRKILLSYTVNDPKRAETLFGFGVDAVFSDCPDKISRFC